MVGYSHDGVSTSTRKEGHHVEKRGSENFPNSPGWHSQWPPAGVAGRCFRISRESGLNRTRQTTRRIFQQQLQVNHQDTEPVANVEPITEPANPDTDPAPNIGDITPQPGKELNKDIECPLPSKQCCRTKITEELPDLKPLKDCPRIFPSTLFPLSQTGVTDHMYHDCIRLEGQSVYGCNLCCTDLSLCEYTSVQFSQMCTHIRRKHLAICIQCRICGKHSFRAVDMSAHL